MQNQDLGLILSSNVKPRLKWTPELHQKFVKSVSQLGGAEKATPKSLMRMMGVPGITLFHLKSHLQKFRLGKNQHSDTFSDNKQEDYGKSEIRGDYISAESVTGAHEKMNERLQITQALQMQMEVQKKLHDQMEVQRHLQLRIEAQGKYLQSVLKRAQETLSGCKSSAMEYKVKRAQSADSSILGTEIEDLSLRKEGKRSGEDTDCSMDSSLTSSDTFEEKDKKRQRIERTECHENNKASIVLQMPGNQCKTGSKNKFGEKNSGIIIYNGPCVTSTTKSPIYKEKLDFQLKKLRGSEELDLNSQCENEIDSRRQELDLNRKEPETL